MLFCLWIFSTKALNYHNLQIAQFTSDITCSSATCTCTIIRTWRTATTPCCGIFICSFLQCIFFWSLVPIIDGPYLIKGNFAIPFALIYKIKTAVCILCRLSQHLLVMEFMVEYDVRKKADCKRYKRIQAKCKH